MTTLTLELNDERLNNLQKMALSQGLSVDELMDKTVDMMVKEYEAYQRFKARAKQGDVERGLALLQKAMSK